MIEFDKIYNEDCLEGMKRMPNKSVDCIICDLPYFQVVKDAFDNQWACESDYLAWVAVCLAECERVLKENGTILLFCSRQNAWKICLSLCDLGFTEQRQIIWARKRSFNNTRGKALASGYEPILYWTKGISGTFNNVKVKSESNRKEYTTGMLKDGITMSDVWCDIPALPHNSKEKTGHPTQKPERLIERMILQFTNENDVVLDFCIGSGTTAVSCLKNHRHFIGFEIDTGYCDIANKRLNELTH